MEAILITVLVVLLVVVLGLLVWMVISAAASRREVASQSGAIGLLQQQLEALKTSQDKTGSNLSDSLNKNLQSSQKVLGQLNTQIGELSGTNKQMLQIGTDVRRLGDILSSPKLRGQFGEMSLENLLSNVLPKESFEMQYTFKDGKIVDGLVKMADYSVSIDAKFPLASFERILNAENDETRAKERKQFQRDVIIHIDKIAADYIRPAEGTGDFAMMYIPAENVYYETVIKYDGDVKDIMRYALDKKVVPVSPNLLYAYLMTVAMGLSGLAIEKKAEEIRQNLKKLNSGFASFGESWEVLGKHMRNASSQYEEGNQRLNKFGMQLEQIQSEDEN